MSGALGTAADNDQYTFPLNAGDTVYGSLDLDLDPDLDPDPERDGDGNGQLISLATTPAAQPASRAGAARG